MKAQDYRNKRRELENQIAKLSKESRSRLLKLCKANPDVVLYQYLDTVLHAGVLDKDNIQRIEGNTVLDYIEIIEKHIESRNPRKQLELDLKDQK